MILSEYFEISGYCYNKAGDLSGSYNNQSFQLQWTVTSEAGPIHFSGGLRSLGANHLVIVGQWASSDCSGNCVLTKLRDSKFVDVPVGSTQPLCVNDRFKGANIQLSDDGQIARRTASYSDAICSSDAPLAVVDGCRSYEVMHSSFSSIELIEGKLVILLGLNSTQVQTHIS